MASFDDYAAALLNGGLPSAIDLGLTGSAQGDTRPEQTAPAGTKVATAPTTTLAQYAPILLLGGGVLIVGVIVWRLAARK